MNDITPNDAAQMTAPAAPSPIGGEGLAAVSGSAMDCIEWLRIFRQRYDAHLDHNEPDAADAVEYMFYAMWDGHGRECSRRWCDIIGAPVEDGGKVLHQEPPYECLRTWLLSRNDKTQQPREQK